MAATMDRPSPLPPWFRDRDGVGPVEALEDPGRLLGRHARAGVLDHDLGLVAVLVHADRGGGARGRVGPHVGQQVVDHLAQPAGVADDLDGREAVNSTGHCGPTVAAVCTASAPSPTSSIGHDLDRLALVEAGQGEQVADQAVHSGRLGPDAGHHPGQVVGVLGRRPARTARHRRTRRRSGCAARARRRPRTGAGADPTPSTGPRRPRGPRRPTSIRSEHDVEGPGQPARPRWRSSPRAPAGRDPRPRWSRRCARRPRAGAGPDGPATTPPASASTRAPAVTASSISSRVCRVLVVSPMGRPPQ